MWPFNSSDSDDEERCEHEFAYFVKSEDRKLSSIRADREKGDVYILAGDICTVFCEKCGEPRRFSVVDTNSVYRDYFMSQETVEFEDEEEVMQNLPAGTSWDNFNNKTEYDEEELRHETEEVERSDKYTSWTTEEARYYVKEE